MSDRPARTAMLGVPCYGGLSEGAAGGAFRAASGLGVRVRMVSHSLLAHSFNQLWCQALNERANGPLDYFAMQHADVEPPPGWLDVLVGELEAKELDVLGVAVAMKDTRGLTSTAVARGDGDRWAVRGRLSTTELHRLPETFTSADVGGPLLLNTGLWVCRFDPRWASRVHFEISDRIVRDADGTYRAEVEPEDWHFSRQLHRHGLKVGCTRKVPVAHRGQAVYVNAVPWGRYEFDRDLLSEPLVPEGVGP